MVCFFCYMYKYYLPNPYSKLRTPLQPRRALLLFLPNMNHRSMVVSTKEKNKRKRKRHLSI